MEEEYRKILRVGVVVVLTIIILLAFISFYTSTQEAISALFKPQYTALVKAVFSLAVLVTSAYLAKRLLK